MESKSATRMCIVPRPALQELQLLNTSGANSLYCMQIQQRWIQNEHQRQYPSSIDSIAKQNPQKLLPPDILLQDDFKDSSVDRQN